MKSIFKIIKATFLGGVLFLVPLVVLLIVLEKIYGVVQKTTLPLVNNLPRVSVLGIALQELIGILLIILISLVAGLLAKTAKAKKLVERLEDGILSFVPGYSFMKNMNENVLGLEAKDDLKVILVPTDAGLQFAFLIEQVSDEKFTVFIPDAPNPWSGSVVFVDKKDITDIDIPQKQALACIRKLGYGSGEFFKNKL